MSPPGRPKGKYQSAQHEGTPMSGTRKTFTLMRSKQRGRRHLLRGAFAAAGAAVLTGCDKLSHSEGFVETLKSAQ